MSIMIPKKPREYTPSSLEGIMFDALEDMKGDYYVFHSFKIETVKNDTFYESETDFLIFHPKKGVICIEAKAGHVEYHDGQWFYASGLPMHNEGPFRQASQNKWKLTKYIRDNGYADLLNKCKFLHAVWFPSITKNDLNSIALPPDCDKAIVMTKEALTDAKQYVDSIFAIELPNKIETTMSTREADIFLKKILCPSCYVFPSKSFDSDIKKIVFHRLLAEQINVLNFLEDQRSAAINGAAGTGKTVIAVEKAKREARKGDKVLFLCYNSMLKDDLSEKNDEPNIDYFTIDGLACKMCNTSVADYARFTSVLEDYYLAGNFPYKHVVIDEGQDFGKESIEESNFLKIIYDCITERDKNGSFFIFYDKLQNVQADKLPGYIVDADSKITLYKNCRNTENIAITSLKPISVRNPELMENAVKGVPAKMYFCSSSDKAIEQVNTSIDALLAEGIKDITILTCKTEKESVLSNLTSNGKFRNKYLFTTYRKFKGLESDAVILVDVDDTTFNKDNVMTYYVGTSRAKLRLEIITQLSEDDCKDILENRLHIEGKIRKAQRELARKLNATGSIV